MSEAQIVAESGLYMRGMFDPGCVKGAQPGLYMSFLQTTTGPNNVKLDRFGIVHKQESLILQELRHMKYFGSHNMYNRMRYGNQICSYVPYIFLFETHNMNFLLHDKFIYSTHGKICQKLGESNTNNFILSKHIILKWKNRFVNNHKPN